jgi:hypothetical protein
MMVHEKDSLFMAEPSAGPKLRVHPFKQVSCPINCPKKGYIPFAGLKTAFSNFISLHFALALILQVPRTACNPTIGFSML